MKKLLVLTAVFALSLALMAQRPAQEQPTRPDSEKTCRDWKEAGKCPRVTERTSCRELIEQGRCPLHNARQAAANAEPRRQCPRSQGATACCGRHGGIGNTAEVSGSAENTTEEVPRRRGRRANRAR
ncbi:MAG: hypothetical protein FWC94_00645 [Bacteroidales bacterium]|nr:hypothetical protein [Bacteroidales bacterium]